MTKEERKALKSIAYSVRDRAADLHFDGQTEISLNRQEFKAVFVTGEVVGQRTGDKIEFFYLGHTVKLDKTGAH